MSVPSSSLSVVIVEDQESIRTVVVMVMKKHGFEVVDFDRGRAALEYLRDAQPDVVVIDSGLPDMPGIQLGREIRRMPGGEETVLALFTGSDSKSLRTQFRKVPFDVFLAKPIGAVDLCETLLQHVQANRQGSA